MGNINRLTKTEQPIQRYIYTLLSVLGRIGFAVITSIIVPNAIGPNKMGIIAFGQVIATNLRSLFDFNISSTFFNLSASRQQSGGLTRVLTRIIFYQIVISISILVIICFTKVGDSIAQGIPFTILLLLLLSEWALFLTNLSNQLGDSKGVSKWPQLIILASNLALTITLVFLAINKSLTVYTYLITTFIFGVLNLFSIIFYLFRIHYDDIWLKKGESNIKLFLKSAMQISIPLTIASYYGMGIEFFERSLIQYKYGPEEQSYYYIALKWTGIVIILMSSSLQIFWQSLVKKFAENDVEAAAWVYKRLDGLLFYFVATFALIWSFMGKEMLSILLGKDFENAGNILVVMAFYPISQVFGQMGTTVAIASGRSKLYMGTSVLTATLGLGVSYFLLIPRNASVPGLELGSFGLAIKTALYGFLATQPITYFNCKYLSISYRDIMVRKFIIFLILSLVLVLLTIICNSLVPFFPVLLIALLKAGFFSIIALALLFIKPKLCGVDAGDILKIKSYINNLKLANLFCRGEI